MVSSFNPHPTPPNLMSNIPSAQETAAERIGQKWPFILTDVGLICTSVQGTPLQNVTTPSWVENKQNGGDGAPGERVGRPPFSLANHFCAV